MNDILKSAIINITNDHCIANGIKPVYSHGVTNRRSGMSDTERERLKQIYIDYDIADLMSGSVGSYDNRVSVMREDFGFSKEMIMDLFDYHRDRISK